MINAVLHQYHALRAWHYNTLATRYSSQMRDGKTDEIRSRASVRLLQVGSLSNHHEKLRDYYARS
jgi:hypothetical protein